jgi:hypothetical protein
VSHISPGEGEGGGASGYTSATRTTLAEVTDPLQELKPALKWG